jgi:hypothetical protein
MERAGPPRGGLAGSCRGGCVGTRQEYNVCKDIEVTSRDQISVQLESLILAQNERWRQA